MLEQREYAQSSSGGGGLNILALAQFKLNERLSWVRSLIWIGMLLQMNMVPTITPLTKLYKMSCKT